MFDKRKENDKRKEPAEPAAANTTESPASQPDTFTSRSTAVIGQTIKIKGTIEGDENLIIEGQVEGSVDLAQHDLTVGGSGDVKANLIAKTIKIDGKVNGDIKGKEKVIVSKSGNVTGNIIAPRVTLEDGAKFKGSIDMDPSDSGAQSAAKSVKSAPAHDAGQNQHGKNEAKQEAS